jgi:hypothetical protein
VDGAISTGVPVTTEFKWMHNGHAGGTMAKSGGWLALTSLRYIHIVLLSLSTAFLGVSLIFLVAPSLSIPFIHLEVAINHSLGFRQTDFIRGYFEYLVPSAALAFCIGISLQLFAGKRPATEILRSGSGVLLLLAPPVFWFCYYQVVGWPFGWPYRWAPVELAVALLCMIFFLLGKWAVPRWISVLALAAHYSFWYYTQSSNPGKADYAGPVAPVLAFCSALAWGLYAARSEQQPEG